MNVKAGGRNSTVNLVSPTIMGERKNALWRNMEELNMGVNEAVEIIPVQDAAVQDDVVTIAEIMSKPSDESAPAQEKVEKPVGDVPQVNTGDDSHPAPAIDKADNGRVSIAFAKRLEAERRKLEKDPVYQLGKMYASQHDGDAAKAMGTLIEQRAQELAKDPAALAKLVLNKNTSEPEPVPDSNVVEKAQVDQILADIRSVIPNDNDVKSYIEADPEFVTNVAEYGAKAAVKMTDIARKNADKAQNMAAKLAQNKQLPQPIRPANNAQPHPIDFANMSSKEFAEYEAKINRERINGKRIMIE